MKGPPLSAPRFATVNEALVAAARSESGLTFVGLHEREVFLPWSEVLERAARCASALRNAGIGPGDRVALVLPTSPAFMDALFGVLLAGAIPVPLYPPVRLGRLAEYHVSTARMLSCVGARMVLTDARVRRLLGRAVERARLDQGCRTVGGLTADSLGALRARVEPDSLALIQFSSGSTVEPRPVALTHLNLMAQCAALKAIMPAERRFAQLGVSWLPLYHDMGLIGCLLGAVYYPGPLVLGGVDGARAGCAVAVGFVPEGESDESLLMLVERASDLSGNDGDGELVDRVRRVVLERTSVRPHAVRVLRPGTLPRTSSGKMKRGEALRRFLSGELDPPKRVGAAGLAVELVRSVIAFAKARVAI